MLRLSLFIIGFVGGVFGFTTINQYQGGEPLFGAPSTALTYQKTLIPITDSLYDLGTSTQAWRNAYIDTLCLSGDCQSSWPAGGPGGTSAYEIATTSNITLSQLAYISKTTGRTTLASVATTSLTATSPLSLSQAISVIGSAASALSIDTSGAWSGTAGALAGNGANCSAGLAAGGVTAAGAAEDCTDYWTEAENTSAAYISDGNTNWDNSYGFITATDDIKFSTTSANWWSSLGLGHSTTSFNNGFNVALAATTSVQSITTLGSLSLPFGQLSGAPTSYPTSTLLANSNTFSGTLNTFSNTIKVASLSGLVGANSGLLYGFASSSLFGYTPLNPTRNINTTFPLAGGGDLSADRTLTFGGLSTSSAIAAGAAALYSTGVNTIASVATSTPTISSGLAYSGTLGNFLGGSSGNLTCATGSGTVFGCLPAANFVAFNANRLATSAVLTQGQVLVAGAGGNTAYSVATGTLAASGLLSVTAGQSVIGSGATVSLSNINANTVIGNLTGASAAPTAFATSSLFAAGTPGNILMYSDGLWRPHATATCIQITGSAGLCDGDDGGGAGGAFSYTPTTNYGALANATGTPMWFQAGIQASTTNNYFAGLTVDNATNGDAIFTQGKSGYEWSLGYNSTNNNFVIASSTALTTSVAFSIDKNLLVSMTNASTTQLSALSGYFGGLPGGVASSTFNARIGLASSTPSFLWGISIGTSTVLQGGQFAVSYASSSAQAATYTVNWDTSNAQRFILNQATTLIINATSSNPRDGGNYILKLCQDGTGSRTVTYATPGQLIWLAGNRATTTVASTAYAVTLIGMKYDARAQRYDVLASSTSAGDTRSCNP